MKTYVCRYIFVLWICLFSYISFGANGDSEDEFLEVHPDDSEEEKQLTIRKTFPQYRIHFNSKRIQEEVFEEFLKEQKASDQKDSSDL